MDTFYIIIFFILGIVMGSFYNVVGFRLSLNKSIVKPGSYCPNCKEKLKVLDLIPVFSYLFLKGKCRYCHQKISIFYPVVELFTGVLFAVSFYSFGFSYELLIALALSSFLAIVIVSDLNYYIIPDQVTLFFGVFIFLINILNYGMAGALKYILYGFAMFAFMYLVMLLGNTIFKQESLGGGDIKLLFVLGMTLPLILDFIGVIVATLLAFPIAIFFLVKHKDKMLPFGPFLIAGFLLIYMFKIDINDVYNLMISFKL